MQVNCTYDTWIINSTSKLDSVSQIICVQEQTCLSGLQYKLSMCTTATDILKELKLRLLTSVTCLVPYPIAILVNFSDVLGDLAFTYVISIST